MRWTTLGWGCWFVLTGAMEVLSDGDATPAALHGAAIVARALALGAIYGAVNTLQLVAALRVTARYPVVGRRAWRNLVRHGAAAVATGVVFAAGDALASLLGHGTLPEAARVLRHAPGYLVLAVIAHAALYARRASRALAADRRLRERLERVGRHRAEAELRALKAELHPLLLEDALDVATTLVRPDPARAQRVLTELGAMMREAVSRATVREVTMEEELEALAPLVQIASAAHLMDRTDSQERPWLVVEMTPELRDALVPHFVLHPVVAHASRRVRDDEALTLRVRQTGDGGRRLELSVLVVPAPRGSVPAAVASVLSTARSEAAVAQALAMLGRRLTALHGDAATLRVGAPDDPVAATVTIPFHADGESWDVPAIDVPQPEVRAATPARGFVVGALEGWTLAIARRTTTSAHDRLVGLVWGAALVAGVGEALGLLATVTPASASPLVAVGARGLRVVAMLLLAVRLPRVRALFGADDARSSLRLHAGAAAATAALATASHVLVRGLAHSAGVAVPDGPPVTTSAPLFFAALVALYVVLAGAVHAITSVRGRRRTAKVVRELRLALATAAHQRARAELRALKAELNPHFVGNALHTANALVRHDPAAAEQMLQALASLAREAAAQTATEEVTLTQELACLQPFLAIERARLGLAAGALSVDWEVAPDVLDAWVPHSVLQPLVENAVRHGLAPRGGAGRLTVRARRTQHPRRPASGGYHVPRPPVAASPASPASAASLVNGAPEPTWLELAVIDDGVGLAGTRAETSPPSPPRPGTGGVGSGAGSRGIHGRLAALYGPLALFELVPGSDRGTVARLVIPLRVSSVVSH